MKSGWHFVSSPADASLAHIDLAGMKQTLEKLPLDSDGLPIPSWKWSYRLDNNIVVELNR